MLLQLWVQPNYKWLASALTAEGAGGRACSPGVIHNARTNTQAACGLGFVRGYEWWPGDASKTQDKDSGQLADPGSASRIRGSRACSAPGEAEMHIQPRRGEYCPRPCDRSLSSPQGWKNDDYILPSGQTSTYNRPIEADQRNLWATPRTQPEGPKARRAWVRGVAVFSGDLQQGSKVWLLLK